MSNRLGAGRDAAPIAATPLAVVDYHARAGGAPAGRGPKMGDVVNLSQFRKKRARGSAEKRAQENRARYGRSKDERAKAHREAEKSAKELDDKRLD